MKFIGWLYLSILISFSSFALDQKMTAEQAAIILKPAQTMYDFIYLMQNESQRHYFLRLAHTGQLSPFAPPHIVVDSQANLLTLSGDWGQTIFDFKASDQNTIVINKRRYPKKNFYRLEDFAANLESWFLPKAFADENSEKGLLAAATAQIYFWWYDSRKEIAIRIPIVRDFQCENNLPTSVSWGVSKQRLDFTYASDEEHTQAVQKITYSFKGNVCTLDFDVETKHLAHRPVGNQCHVFEGVRTEDLNKLTVDELFKGIYDPVFLQYSLYKELHRCCMSSLCIKKQQEEARATENDLKKYGPHESLQKEKPEILDKKNGGFEGVGGPASE